ncbi:MAG: alpha/beta fold hydrolase [Deltaproteobacteria bacterium]|nr:alpha/beta fold hydrolase [Deltaproteobacteria bacterium]MBI3296069.1 alpha/beta fold hydrolase [Deltaproteobacteria bacterium]
MKSLLVGLFFLVSMTAVAAPDLLMVAMGGHTSCGLGELPPIGSKLYRPFTEWVSALRRDFPDRKFRQLTLCFNEGLPPDADMVGIDSEDPRTVFVEDGHGLVKRIDDLAKSRQTQVILLGHSYGGYLAMFLAANLQRKVEGLFSIDPIGPNCEGAGGLFSGACEEAPTDLNNKAIRERTRVWVNIYQTQDWLHSSEIAEAENILMSYRGPHNQIHIDPKTWHAIDLHVRNLVR